MDELESLMKGNMSQASELEGLLGQGMPQNMDEMEDEEGSDEETIRINFQLLMELQESGMDESQLEDLAVQADRLGPQFPEFVTQFLDEGEDDEDEEGGEVLFGQLGTPNAQGGVQGQNGLPTFSGPAYS